MTINTWNRLFHYLFATLLLASSLHAATPLEDFGYFYDDPAALTAAQPEDPAFRAQVAALLARFARREKPTAENTPYQEISTSPDAQKVVVTVHLIHDLLMFADDAINTNEDDANQGLRRPYDALIASIQINHIRMEDMVAEYQALTDLITLLNMRENLQAIISLDDIQGLQVEANPYCWRGGNAPIKFHSGLETMLTDPLLQRVFDLAIYQMQTYNPTISPHPEASTDTTTIAVHNDLEAFVKILRLLADRIKSDADRDSVNRALANMERLARYVEGGETMLAEARHLCGAILSPPQHVYYPQLARRAQIR